MEAAPELLSTEVAKGGAGPSGPPRPLNRSVLSDSNAPASGSDGKDSTFAQLVEKKLDQMKRKFAAKHREKAPDVMAANKDKIRKWAQQRSLDLQQLPKTGPIQKTSGEAIQLPPSKPAEGSIEQQELKPLALCRNATLRIGKEPVPVKAALHLIPHVKPPPTYITWAYLQRNELARDHGKRMFYTDASGETVPASDDEDESMPWEGRNGAAIDYALVEIAKEFGQTDEVLEALSNKLRVGADCIALRLNQLLLQQSAGNAERANQEVEDTLDTFFGFFCRRCRTYSCRLHGGGHVRPHQRPQPPPAREEQPACGPKCWRSDSSLQAMMQKHQMHAGETNAAGSAAPAGPASANVHDATMEDGAEVAAMLGVAPLAASEDVTSASGLPLKGPPKKPPPPRASGTASGSGGTGGAVVGAVVASRTSGGGSSTANVEGTSASACNANANTSSAGWSVWETSLFNKAYQVFGSDCCAMAKLIGTRPCAEVAVQLAVLKESTRIRGEPELKVGGGGAGGRKAGRQFKKSKKSAYAPVVTKKSAVVMKRFYHSADEAWAEYAPCTCVGICGSDCACTKSKNFCEKYCACSQRCINRFKGCRCTSQCKTRMCPCVSAGRECDPDLCRNCSSTCDHANPPPPGSECGNMRLRMRQHMRIIMGESTIHGWGAFVLGECKKDDFLGEYTGDLITQDEADRRGRIYDKINNSYLFNLNEQWVLDARHRGNKLRFANHSLDPNCKARIMLVDGDHRVAIFANKNISAGEELFYDYRYEREQAPDWAQKD